MRELDATVILNRRVASDFHHLVLACPGMETDIAPGQFVTVRGDWAAQPLLRRPFTIYDYDADNSQIALAVKRVGKATKLLTQTCPGDKVSLVGPLGKGFDLVSLNGPGSSRIERLYIVAGGCGIASQPLLARNASTLGIAEIVLLYGAASADECPIVDEVTHLVGRASVAPEDGTRGTKGLVTDLLIAELDRGTDGVVVCACGPKPMLGAVAAVTETTGVRCLVNLEAHMACGIGVCNGCVVPIATPGGRVWRQCCTDGPVFDAASVVWAELQ